MENSLTGSLLETIKSDIEKHLPKQVGEELQKRLSLVDELEELVNSLNKKVENRNDEIVKLRCEVTRQSNEIKKQKEIKSQLLELSQREIKLEERSRNIEIEILRIRLSESDKRADEMHGIVQTVFRSPVYRKSVTRNDLEMHDNVYDSNGNYVNRVRKNGETEDVEIIND